MKEKISNAPHEIVQNQKPSGQRAHNSSSANPSGIKRGPSQNNVTSATSKKSKVISATTITSSSTSARGNRSNASADAIALHNLSPLVKKDIEPNQMKPSSTVSATLEALDKSKDRIPIVPDEPFTSGGVKPRDREAKRKGQAKKALCADRSKARHHDDKKLKRNQKKSTNKRSLPKRGKASVEQDAEKLMDNFEAVLAAHVAPGSVKIRSEKWTSKEFARKVKTRKVDVCPEYQRDLVWSEAKSSRLNVTRLANRWISPIVLRETDSNCGPRYEVVDGKQRALALCGFILYENDDQELGQWDPIAKEQLANILPKVGTLRRLTDEYEQLNTLTFNLLRPKWKEFVEEYSIDIVVIPSGISKELIFKLYEDINMGGVPHSAQMLRRVVFAGSFMEMVESIRFDCKDFHFIRDPNKFAKESKKAYQRDSRESDGELILMAFAFEDTHDEKPEMRITKKFLNDASARLSAKSKDEIARVHKTFKTVMSTVRQIFQEDAFRVHDRSSTRSQHLSKRLWVAKYSAFAKVLKSGTSKEELRLAKASIQQRVGAYDHSMSRKLEEYRDDLEDIIRKSLPKMEGV